MLLAAAMAVAYAEACTLVVSLVVGPTNDVSTTDWFSLDSIGAGLLDYATVMGGVTGWAIFGATLAVIFRSVQLALGVGFAWAGPIENHRRVLQTGYRVSRPGALVPHPGRHR